MSRKPTIATVVVRAELPPGLTKRDFLAVVDDAVDGRLRSVIPDEPLAKLDRKRLSLELPNKHLLRLLDAIHGSIIRARQTVAALEDAPVTREWMK